MENNLKNQAFGALGVASLFDGALDKAGYETPSPIQARTIPFMLSGNDVLGIAQTGTGKTAAFGLPLLQNLAEKKRKPESKKPRSLVLAPTRELALQINQELTLFARDLNLKFTVIFGGVGQNPQVSALRRGVDVLIATPGRLLDLAAQKHVDLRGIELLVLDEADRLLDMGFIRDVRKIVAMTPRSRQSLLFSATMPAAVSELAEEMLKNPKRVEVTPKQVTVEKIDQYVVHVDQAHKREALQHLLLDGEVSKAIVFTRTKYGAEKLAKQLRKADINAEAIHGNKSQNARNRALDGFKQGKVWVLVATDVASRGIDIEGVSHVVNFELPHEPESYVHRIGRTGRAGATGCAWSLVDSSEMKRLRAIERFAKHTIAEVTPDWTAAIPELKSEAPPKPRGNERSESGNRGTGGSRSDKDGHRAGASSSQQDNPSKKRRRRRRRRKPAAATA